MYDDDEYSAKRSLLDSLDDNIQADIRAAGRERDLKRGEILFHHGDDGDMMAIVLSGTLKVYLTTLSGREIVLDYLGEGQMSGEMALFSRQPRTANVAAAEAAKVVTLTRAQVVPYLEHNGRAAIGVIEALVQRLARTNALVEQYGMPMGQKLATGLIRLFETHGKTDDDGSALSFKLSQSDLGNHVGLTRENVNRQLKDWERDGVIKLDKGRITLLDPDALEEIAEFDWD